MPVLRRIKRRKTPSAAILWELTEHIQSKLGCRELASWSRWYANLQLNPRFRLYASILDAIEKGSVPRLHAIETLRMAGGLTLGAIYTALGANPDLLPLMSVALNRTRTRPIPNQTHLSNTLLWLPSRVASPVPSYQTAALSQMVTSWTRQPIANLAIWRRQRCLYAQIGLEDGNSFPAFPPGAFIQIDPTVAVISGTADPNYYFLQHPFGYSCCRCAVEGGRIFVLSRSNLYPQLEFEHPGVVRIIGRVHGFCGRIDEVAAPPAITERELESRSEQPWNPAGSRYHRLRASELLHTQRLCLGITYAEIDHLTERLRGVVPNWERFRMSGGHVHKIDHDPQHVPSARTLFPLLALYGLEFREVLATYGLSADDSHMIELPCLHDRSTVTELAMGIGSSPARNPLAAAVLDRWLELPALLFQLGPDPRSGNIYFYTGHGLEPMINAGAFLLVDKAQVEIPVNAGATGDFMQWQRPVFLFELREGRFAAGYAERDRTRIHIIPHPGSRDRRVVTISEPSDGRIVGRIVAAASLV